MSSRFEQIITGAVVTGVIALAGCASSGGDDGGTDTPLESDLQFWGARATSDTELKLFFSDPVTLPENLDALAGFFALHRSEFAASIAYQSRLNVCTGLITSPSTACTTSGDFVTAATPVFDVASGDEIGTITGVEVSENDPNNLIITLSASIPGGADDGTGVLRLRYTGDEDGLLDADGAYAPVIALAGDVLGNAAIPGGGPVMVFAHTIDAQTVELIFNQPISIRDGDLTAAKDNFALDNNCFYSNTTLVGAYDPDNSLAYYNVTAILSAWFSALPPTSTTLAIPAIASLTLPNGVPNTIRLHLSGSIPDTADHNGYLRLTYMPVAGPGDVQGTDGGLDMAGVDMQSANEHRGNVLDTNGADGTNTCTVF